MGTEGRCGGAIERTSVRCNVGGMHQHDGSITEGPESQQWHLGARSAEEELTVTHDTPPFRERAQ